MGMFDRMRRESEDAVRCGICGERVGQGEPYIIAENEYICRNCSENLEIWQVLELLELSEIIDLFEERGRTGRAGEIPRQRDGE